MHIGIFNLREKHYNCGIFICEVVKLFYYLAAQLVIKTKDKERYPVLSQVRIRRYTSQVAPTNVISDYRMSVQYNNKNPVLVGRCNISSEQQRIVLERSLAVSEMTYDNFLTYKRYFEDGFVITSNVMTQDDIKNYITSDMTAKCATMTWRVKYDE